MDVSYRRIDCNNCAGSLSYQRRGYRQPQLSADRTASLTRRSCWACPAAALSTSAPISTTATSTTPGTSRTTSRSTTSSRLNLGLRYDLQHSAPGSPLCRTATSTRRSRIPTPDGILGALEFASEDSKILLDTRKNALAPRLGFAYQLSYEDRHPRRRRHHVGHHSRRRQCR